MLNKIVINGLVLIPSCRAIRYSKVVEVMNESQCSLLNIPGDESMIMRIQKGGKKDKRRSCASSHQTNILCDCFYLLNRPVARGGAAPPEFLEVKKQCAQKYIIKTN